MLILGPIMTRFPYFRHNKNFTGKPKTVTRFELTERESRLVINFDYFSEQIFQIVNQYLIANQF